MEKEGAKYVEIKGFDDKRQLTAVFGATMTAGLLRVGWLVNSHSIINAEANTSARNIFSTMQEPSSILSLFIY